MLNLTLKIWRQSNPLDGKFVTYEVWDINPDMSFLEMLDVLNQQLIIENKDPVTFDHDCREGICGSCSLVINGEPHGGKNKTTACQLHMRHFNNGDTITIEPFRAQAFPIVKDLMVNRQALDRILAKGGYISANTGSAPEANSVPISKSVAEEAFNAATCIGCGACVAACRNQSASLFLGAKVTHLNTLPQGKPEAMQRVFGMASQMQEEGFGHCSNLGSCAEACPKGIPLTVIATLNKEFINSLFSFKGGK
jgi:succinate dehydrogenase / fumarate reductase, iron-sulfur subunit